jgi:ABC-type polysaccharide/polyol phosphate export permease
MHPWRDRAQLVDVVREVAISDFRLKYNDSVLGYFWGLLSPVLMLLVYVMVFRHIIGVRGRSYETYVLIGVVFWTFFQDCTFSGLNALTRKAGVMRSVPLPVIVVVASGMVSTLLTLAINTVLLCLVLAFLGALSPLAPFAVLPIACLALLAAGTGFFVALAYVHFRDTGLIWHTALQALFWMTPIVYPVESQSLAGILYLNPIARCLYLIRWFLTSRYFPATRFIVLTVLFCVGVFALGLFMFVRRQREIPEAL